jgi:NAD(P)-dependent dehydrogenase (short-subunit alcohol dehydrogenase family)
MIAQAFTENGAHVFISSRNAKQCEQAAEQLTANHGPGTCVALPADLSTTTGCKHLVTQLHQALNDLQAKKQRAPSDASSDALPALDVLVNNSGCSWGEDIAVYSEKGWDKVMDLNVKCLFFLTRDLLPYLDAAASKAEPARVINIGSIAGMVVLHRYRHCQHKLPAHGGLTVCLSALLHRFRLAATASADICLRCEQGRCASFDTPPCWSSC